MRNRACLSLAVSLGFVACSSGLRPFNGADAGKTTHQSNGAPETLSAAGEQELHAIVKSGRLQDLKWPDFSDRGASVKEFYDLSGYKLEWTRDGKPTAQAAELIGILQDAGNKGLDGNDYDGQRWSDRLKALQSGGGASESGRVKFDVALTVSATRYISDLHLGKVDPENLHKDFDPEREHHDAGAFLQEKVIDAPSVKEALLEVECPYPGYQRELVALQKYLQMEKDETRNPLPQLQKPIDPGQPYSGASLLVKRLQFLGDLPVSADLPADANVYSAEVAEGVRRFQSRHGIEANGKLGPQTITELNEPMAARVMQLRLSLERWRWLPHSFTQPPIMVNIPEFKLRAFDSSGNRTLFISVVVGTAMRTETPVLEEDMKYVVFWPYWNVPPSIARTEMIPKITKDRGFLQQNNYEVVTFGGQLVTDGSVSDEVLAQLRAGRVMIRQKPGPKNALGLVKFIFPNDKNIYLHSTPAQALFAKTRRDFSHGCIRVEDPEALAVWVLRNNTGWTKERIESAFKAEKEQQVNLASTIPVLVLYSSAIAEEDGRVFFFKDIYGHDKSLAKLEAQAYSTHN